MYQSLDDGRLKGGRKRRTGEEWRDQEKEKKNRLARGLEEVVYVDRRMWFSANLDVFVRLLCEMFCGRG